MNYKIGFKLGVLVLALSTTLGDSAMARRREGRSGNINVTWASTGFPNSAAGWTKCRRVADGTTFWVNPTTGVCEHWTTKACINTGGTKISDAPRNACPI